MKNIYDGVAILDNSGRATVTMPDWFDALNEDFRYQLTCIGGYAPVYIESEISKGTFAIAGGKSGMKVSWQVTGIRHDAYAAAHPIEVEVIKNDDEKGLYSHPDVFGQPETRGIDYVREHEDELANPERAAALEKMKNERPPVQGKPAERETPTEVVTSKAPSSQ